ncbi:hypothetical protein TNCV_86631 [Trichonephila clavipes]|nr:hypothetical protein TNCV_86631 [Trichonephila clavipes]
MDVSWFNVRFVIRPYVIVGLQCKCTMTKSFPSAFQRWNMPLGRDKSVLASFMSNEFLSCFAKTIVTKKTLGDNFKSAIMEAKHVNEFRQDVSKGLLSD